jgi:hypothetical protein
LSKQPMKPKLVRTSSAEEQPVAAARLVSSHARFVADGAPDGVAQGTTTVGEKPLS